jgi:hypothetical protein
MTAVAPRPLTAAAVDALRSELRDLARAGVAGPWHYRWPELEAVAARLGLSPKTAYFRAETDNWPAPTVADHIREATR